jgi:hypothetical protein
MDMNGQFNDPAALTAGTKTGTNVIRGSVGPRAGLDAFCWESNLSSSVFQPVTEKVYWLSYTSSNLKLGWRNVESY